MDCMCIREQMLDTAREKISKIGEELTLAIVQVGDDPASAVYIRNKIKTCAKVGIETRVIKCPSDITFHQLRQELITLAANKYITGVMLQLPLHEHLKLYEQQLLNCIPWYKDVDGLSAESVGRLWTGQDCITPATPTGILQLLPSDLTGYNATIINRSNLIGKPLTKLLLDRNATVTVCHSKTQSIHTAVENADIVITGIGKPQYFTTDYISEVNVNGIWIDCGICRTPEGMLCGDIDSVGFEEYGVSVTPVPGGVGQLTTAQLMLNTVKAYKLIRGSRFEMRFKM